MGLDIPHLGPISGDEREVALAVGHHRRGRHGHQRRTEPETVMRSLRRGH
jgi:hypothetical protein